MKTKDKPIVTTFKNVNHRLVKGNPTKVGSGCSLCSIAKLLGDNICPITATRHCFSYGYYWKKIKPVEEKEPTMAKAKEAKVISFKVITGTPSRTSVLLDMLKERNMVDPRDLSCLFHVENEGTIVYVRSGKYLGWDIAEDLTDRHVFFKDYAGIPEVTFDTAVAMLMEVPVIPQVTTTAPATLPFKPFDKVLVYNIIAGLWVPDIFLCATKDEADDKLAIRTAYAGASTLHAIAPYEGNSKCAGTKDDPSHWYTQESGKLELITKKA